MMTCAIHFENNDVTFLVNIVCDRVRYCTGSTSVSLYTRVWYHYELVLA